MVVSRSVDRVADISVVIPSFERTSLALETVRSVLAQSHPVREIILVANGSPDHAAFWEANAGGTVRVVREAARGQQAARNAGIRAATSTWVATLDDDDLYEPDFIASVIPATKDCRADIVSTDHRKFWPERDYERTNFEAAPSGYWRGIRPADHSAEWSFVGEFPLQLLLQRIPIYPSTAVIRREFALAIGGYDPRMYGIASEDVEFLTRVLTYGKVAFVWQPLVRYRMHNGNFSRNAERRAIGRWRIFEFVRENHPHLPPAFRSALDRDLPRRRRQIFRLAYRLRDKELMEELWTRLRPVDCTPDILAFRLAAKHLPGNAARVA